MAKECKLIGQVGGVYQIRNTSNQKAYVGSTKCFTGRWKTHKIALRNGIHPNRYLQNAWNKHGEKAFKFEILIKCRSSLCLKNEQKCIDERTLKNLYNLAPKANGVFGIKWSEKSKEAFRARWNEIYLTPEYIQHMKAIKFGTKRSKQAIEKHKLWMSKNRAKLGAAIKRGLANPEARRKMREAAARRWASRKAEIAKVNANNRKNINPAVSEGAKRGWITRKANYGTDGGVSGKIANKALITRRQRYGPSGRSPRAAAELEKHRKQAKLRKDKFRKELAEIYENILTKRRKTNTSM